MNNSLIGFGSTRQTYEFVSENGKVTGYLLNGRPITREALQAQTFIEFNEDGTFKVRKTGCYDRVSHK